MVWYLSTWSQFNHVNFIYSFESNPSLFIEYKGRKEYYCRNQELGQTPIQKDIKVLSVFTHAVWNLEVNVPVMDYLKKTQSIWPLWVLWFVYLTRKQTHIMFCKSSWLNQLANREKQSAKKNVLGLVLSTPYHKSLKFSTHKNWPEVSHTFIPCAAVLLAGQISQTNNETKTISKLVNLT